MYRNAMPPLQPFVQRHRFPNPAFQHFAAMMNPSAQALQYNLWSQYSSMQYPLGSSDEDQFVSDSLRFVDQIAQTLYDYTQRYPSDPFAPINMNLGPQSPTFSTPTAAPSNTSQGYYPSSTNFDLGQLASSVGQIGSAIAPFVA